MSIGSVIRVLFRIALLVVIWKTWGLGVGIGTILALSLIQPEKNKEGIVVRDSFQTLLRYVLEFVVNIAGLIAVNTLYGSDWVIFLVAVYILSLFLG